MKRNGFIAIPAKQDFVTAATAPMQRARRYVRKLEAYCRYASIRLSALCSSLAVPIMAVAAGTSPYTAHAEGAAAYTVHTFAGDLSEGFQPMSLTVGPDGNLYGANSSGGSGLAGTVGGTIFKLSPDQTFTVLHTFSAGGSIGEPEYPIRVLFGPDGSLYGAAAFGSPIGTGSVFKITPDGTFSTLYAFSESGATDGNIVDDLILGSDGNFYGVTNSVGPNGWGTLFKLTPEGTLTTIYAFSGTAQDGSNPTQVTIGNDGNFYVTTAYFYAKVTPAGIVTRLHAFDSIGGGPMSRLVPRSDGSFYATIGYNTSTGPAAALVKLNLDDTFSILHTFQPLNKATRRSPSRNVDGSLPFFLFIASDGNLYGTALRGGVNADGTVFKMSPNGDFSTLYAFTGLGDGASPAPLLIQDANGALLAATDVGGSNGAGTIDKITLQSPLSASLSISPTTAVKGQTVTVTWSSTGATGCQAVGDVYGSAKGSKPLSGTANIVVTRPGTYVFGLQCMDSSGGTANTATELTVIR